MRTARHTRGFTLIEIMIVIAIMAIVMTIGVPSIYRAMRRDDLARAMNDTVEGCKTARDRAILQGVPYEFVVSEGGQLNARPRRAVNCRFPLPLTTGFRASSATT